MLIKIFIQLDKETGKVEVDMDNISEFEAISLLEMVKHKFLSKNGTLIEDKDVPTPDFLKGE